MQNTRWTSSHDLSANFSLSTYQPNIALLVGLVWSVVVGQMLWLDWSQTAHLLGDSDDAMRLVEMRAFLAGRGWFDLHEPRLQPPLGYDSHWSRLIDAGLAGLFLIFRNVTDAATAERLTRVVWPSLWLLPAIAGTAALAWRLGGRAAAQVALLLLSSACRLSSSSSQDALIITTYKSHSQYCR